MVSHTARALLGLLAAALAGLLACPVRQAGAATPPPRQPVAVGYGGAVATVDPDATRVGLAVLRRGGNAVDAAVATAAALGVSEPYVAGIGGGGFMVIYLAGPHRIVTIDGRESAPRAMTPDAFLDPATGAPIPFSPERVTSGLAVGVPGTLASWDIALRRFGTVSLASALQPGIALAARGFAVDQTFRDQTEQNLARFRAFTSTRRLFLTPNGDAPPVGSLLRNPDLARAYRLIARDGARAFYAGPVGAAIVEAAVHPPLATEAPPPFAVRPSRMTLADLKGYRALLRPPVKVAYRGYEVAGMGPPSSGGTTVGEALQILAGFRLSASDRPLTLHRLLESERLAFADRGRFVGDPALVRVPIGGLTAPGFAAERRCLIGPTALVSPVAPGDPSPPYAPGCPPSASSAAAPAREGTATTHLTVADRLGNVVSYTQSIEQTGGSGIAVPGFGFLLNNELTDFDPAPAFPGQPDPNLPAPGARPRSSMSPTIVLRGGRPALALGSPGGATIITTVLQILVDRLDLGMPLPQAIADPRASQRNTPITSAEPAFIAAYGQPLAQRFGQSLVPVDEIGAATAIALLGGGRMQAVAEPVRRGGGAAGVVCREGSTGGSCKRLR
ncbi:MAG: gamma-glutamyltranspeptidase / glutathione hydrolase [Miltoncostaeaceae bacterium]|nr:gamma-glutamyltranspeptidase / glutathione hydrolase [Miltoncostaeaceae bacterium]